MVCKRIKEGGRMMNKETKIFKRIINKLDKIGIIQFPKDWTREDHIKMWDESVEEIKRLLK